MPQPAVAHDAPPTGTTRLAWVDHLRAVLTVFVVAHHAAQAYGPTGGAWPVANPTRAPLLGVFISVNAMFFMGLFFFVSGCFTPGTLTRKGARAFVRDRLWRLGAPSLLVLLLTALFTEPAQFLHLWFVVDLLALNLLYVAFASRRATERPVPAPPTTAAAMPTSTLAMRTLLLVVTLAAGTVLVRVRYPVDRWVNLLGVLPVEPAHAVQYALAFWLGIRAARTRLLERFPERFGAGLLAVAILVVAAYAGYRLWPSRSASWFSGGGASWSMVRLALLEAVVCVSLGGGLLWLFRRALAAPSRALSALAADAYGIYCVHLPIVILVQLAIAALPAGPLVKFMLTTVGALGASWLVTRVVLRSTAFGRRIF